MMHAVRYGCCSLGVWPTRRTPAAYRNSVLIVRRLTREKIPGQSFNSASVDLIFSSIFCFPDFKLDGERTVNNFTRQYRTKENH